jgi:hypothetical protein
MSGNWEDDAAEVVRRRGYLVLSCNAKLPIGFIIRDFSDARCDRQRHPFRVVRATTREDFLEQSAVMGWETLEYSPDGHDYYNVVETD